MLPLLWLALSAPPLAITQIAEPILPQEVALRLVEPPRCLYARCAKGEWVVDAMPEIPSGQRRVDGSALPGAGSQMRLPNERRDWVKAQGSNARVGVQYGVEAINTPGTSVRVAVDTGYRMQGYAEDGIAGTGPVVRGQVEWNQALGDNAKLTQTTRLETGQTGAFLRNNLQLEVQLQPDLILSSGVEMRRDSHLTGRNQTDATLNLRYMF